MTSVAKYYARYGTWNAENCTLSACTNAVKWRMTPRSKAFKAVLPVVRLPDAYMVARATNSYIDIEVSSEIADLINNWCVPDPVPNQAQIIPIAPQDGTIRLYGSHACMNASYEYTDNVVTGGDTVCVRVSPNIREIGRNIGQYKVTLELVDVMKLT